MFGTDDIPTPEGVAILRWTARLGAVTARRSQGASTAPWRPPADGSSQPSEPACYPAAVPSSARRPCTPRDAGGPAGGGSARA